MNTIALKNLPYDLSFKDYADIRNILTHYVMLTKKRVHLIVKEEMKLYNKDVIVHVTPAGPALLDTIPGDNEDVYIVEDSNGVVESRHKQLLNPRTASRIDFSFIDWHEIFSELLEASYNVFFSVYSQKTFAKWNNDWNIIYPRVRMNQSIAPGCLALYNVNTGTVAKIDSDGVIKFFKEGDPMYRFDPTGSFEDFGYYSEYLKLGKEKALEKLSELVFDI